MGREVYSTYRLTGSRAERIPTRVLGAAAPSETKFNVASKKLNMIDDGGGLAHVFPGNIAPEGYFYQPFYEVRLKELSDEPESVTTVRINFDPSKAAVTESSVTYYNQAGYYEDRNVNILAIESPVNYEFLDGQPFCIYDVLDDITYRGYLDTVSGATGATPLLSILTDAPVDADGLAGGLDPSGRSRYIISMLEDNAPVYAEFIPTSQKLVWRGPKKMSELVSDSPIYNMPFTNGRLYVHDNINVFVRRQDPQNEHKLQRPAPNSPLRRFQIEGNEKLDFDYIKYITDSLINTC